MSSKPKGSMITVPVRNTVQDSAPVTAQRTAVKASQLIGIGTTVPEASYTQSELLDEFQITDARIRSLFANSAIRRRHLVLPPLGPDGRRLVESQGELLAKHRENGLRMGAEAIQRCLADVGAGSTDVRHLCCVTTTGFLTPGFSALLIRRLGLSPDTSRLDVVGMGCNAGLNALSMVTGWASAHPGQLAVMVCIEACSAAYVFDGTMRTAVVNSLFGDGAAAVGIHCPAVSSGFPAESPEVLRTASWIITDAIDSMRFDWDDNEQKFSFYLDPAIPYVVGAHAESAMSRLLSDTGLQRSDIAHWLIHSGGKKVVDAVRLNLGLTRYDVRHTIGVLRDYGNLSSASFLFSYERLVAERIVRRGDYGIMMTMGPGSSVELALLGWCAPDSRRIIYE
jgi:polyketide synthase Type III